MAAPRSTYRLQLSGDFTLDDATELLPYLHRLGVDWVYLSPILQASSGSTHGYDVVDPTRVDASRGGRAALERLSRRAHGLGLGVLADIVPNHMGVAVPRENAWWWEVLAGGPGAEHAPYFDIDWDAGAGRILIPVLGDDDLPRHPGDAIGGLEIDAAAGVLRYYEHEYPLAVGTADDGADVRAVHARQHYELIHWRQGDFRINYRRFFTVSELAAVRVEDPAVFDATHAEILRWVHEGLVDGLRIDHIDGLRDPRGYLRRLREAVGPEVYLVVEKILTGDERLPEWMGRDALAQGTTGYDALGAFDRILVDPDGEDGLGSLADRLDEADIGDWATLIHTTKREVADGQLNDAGADDASVVDALAELSATFPVYRSYLPDSGREVLDRAARDAVDWRADLTEPIERILPLLVDPGQPGARRLQQTTGMVSAKSVEDRAFYRYSRLTSLNEVGGEPSEFSIDAAAFHTAQEARFETWPRPMTTLTNHDTKRTEDARARIDALSEVPELWAETVEGLLDAAPIDDRPFANLLWQGIVGAWPASRDRLVGFARKAAREAATITSWVAQDAAFEQQLSRAVAAAFDDPVASNLLTRIDRVITEAGRSNALTMKTLQLCAPGVPDVYQGTELWASALVDPDNRRPVDWSVRRAAIDAVAAGARPGIDASGAAKLFVTAACLHLRRDHPEFFRRYAPLRVTGPSAEHAIGFDRGSAIAIGTRLPIGLERGGGWGSTAIELPDGEWKNLLAVEGLAERLHSGRVPVSALLDQLPVALLVRR